MQILLLRRTLRDLKANIFRYMALLMLIILCMFIVAGTIGSAISVIETVKAKAEANQMEDGQFGVFMPLDKETILELENRNLILEECFQLDFLMEDGSTLRLMKNREKINRVELEEGFLAQAPGEIVIERIYASAHSLSIGDTIKIAGFTYTITGIGTSADYEYCLQNMTDMSSDGKVFGTAFVIPKEYDNLLDSGKSLRAQDYRYSYLLGKGITHTQLKDLLKNSKISSMSPAIIPENLMDFVRAEDNPRLNAAARDVEINIKAGIMAGIIVLILITYVISVFIIHSIDQESSVIGALYALGLKRKQLLWHYTMLPVLLCSLGGAAGTLLGYSRSGLSMMTGESYAYYSIPSVTAFYSPWLLAYGFLLPPATALLVTRLLIQKRLRKSALSLLRRETDEGKGKGIKIRHFGFIRTFQIRQFLREKRSCLAILAGMFVSLLILVLGLNCYSLCRNIKLQNKADTHFAYMYQYKYPTKTGPDGGYPAYVKGMKKEVPGFSMEISIIGLTDDNPFFPAFSKTHKDEICISSSVASKYGLSVGDELVLKDGTNEKQYRFTVADIVPYSPGLNCFMDIESMRSLFNQDEDYYNVVYADQALDIRAEQLYAVSTKADVEKSSDIFMEIMKPLMTMMIMVSTLVFLIVLYQMIKVMMDRSAYGISLMKIFGYQNKEIRKLYLDGSAFLVAAGALVMLPAAKRFMDIIYPSFIANIACGVDLSWPPLLYLLVYGGILLCYFLIRTVLLRKLKKMMPAQILKEKE